MPKKSSVVLKKKKQNTEHTLRVINAVKYAALMTLRNQGWNKVRLTRFSNQFNDILSDVSNGRLSLSDIADTIYDETGLSLKDMRVE
jgi:hypothetical protein